MGRPGPYMTYGEGEETAVLPLRVSFIGTPQEHENRNERRRQAGRDHSPPAGMSLADFIVNRDLHYGTSAFALFFGIESNSSPRLRIRLASELRSDGQGGALSHLPQQDRAQ